MTMKGVIAASLALAVSGCGWFSWGSSGGVQSAVPPGATAYACEGGRTLYVRYLEGGKAAVVILRDREFRLDQVPSGSGVQYSNGRTTLATKGGEALLEEDGKKLYSGCVSGAK